MRLLDAARGAAEPSGWLFEALDPWSGCRPAVRLYPGNIGRRLRRSGGCHGHQRPDNPTGEPKSSAKHSDPPSRHCHRGLNGKVRASLSDT